MILSRLQIFVILLISFSASLNVYGSDVVFEKLDSPGPAEGYTFSRKYVGFPVNNSIAIDQQKFSDAACGPAAVLTAMLYGNAGMRACYESLPGRDDIGKLSYVVNEYGQKPSIEFPGRPRIIKDGICSVDLLCLFNDLLADSSNLRVSGEYTVRAKGESDSHFLRRSHNGLLNSFKKGIPVVAHIRSFAAKRSDDNRSYWYSLSSHFITIIRIPEILSDYENGFTFEYIDPFGAKVESGFIGIEKNRGFTAKVGVNKNKQWVSGRSLLLVSAPSLNLKTSEQSWHDRTIMTLSFLIGDI